jgi:serine/threonine-protein kinase
MADIFLSYASSDRDRVTALVQVLEDAGWHVWWDRAIASGSRWDEVIQRELGAARAVVVVWTKQSVESNWVRTEAMEGLERGILFPVSLDDVVVPLAFKRTQAAALESWRPGQANPEIERLITALHELLDGPTPGRSAAMQTSRVPKARRRWRQPPLLTIVVAMGVVSLALFVWGLRRGEVRPMAAAHLIVELPAGVVLPMNTEHPVLALSPDGARLAFVGEEHGTRRIYVRDLVDPVARPLAGTEGAVDVFFSPDGAWIAYFDAATIKKIAAVGGAPLAIHGATEATVNRGAAWIGSDRLVYAASSNSGLSEGSIGSEPARGYGDWAYITTNNLPYAWPAALSGGDKILFADAAGDTSDASVVRVLSLPDRSVKALVNGGTNPRYSPTGHVLFARAGSLYAVAFDARRTEVSGPERKLLDGVIVEPYGAAQYAVSTNGVLAYVAGPPVTRQHELVWVDRAGHPVTLRNDGREYWFPRLSPDGTKVAVTSQTGSNFDVWILDLERGTLQGVTTASGEDFGPVWSPDGTRLAISSEHDEEEGPGMAWTNGPDFRLEFLLRTPGVGNWEFPTSWSPDGKWLLFTRNHADAASDVEMLASGGAHTPMPFVAEPASEKGAMFAPNGADVAYVSDVSGRDEVYVRPFPGSGAASLVSTNGGIEPVWSRNGQELFYREGDALKSVPMKRTARGTIEPGAPVTLFEGRYDRTPYGGRSANYDVSLDGQRFLMVRRKDLPQPSTIHVVLNWPDALLNHSPTTER